MVGLGGEILEEWARKLKRGGYSATVRHQVVKEALCKYEKMCKVEEKEGRPVNRVRAWQQYARQLVKELKSSNWHKTHQAVISAPSDK